MGWPKLEIYSTELGGFNKPETLERGKPLSHMPMPPGQPLGDIKDLGQV